MKVVKNLKATLLIVAILLVISYFIPVETPSGFVVKENSVLTPEVQEEAYFEGEVDVIVKLKDVEGDFFLYANQEADINEVKKEIIEEFEEKIDLEELDSFAGTITSEGLQELENHPNVEYVQLDHVFSLTLQDSLGIINATKLHNSNLKGSNIGVCVLDTGINYNHVDLADNYEGGHDYVNDDSDPLDDHGHGTHVSGIVQGVAPSVRLAHVKVLNSAGSGSESDIAAGINWCVTNKDSYNVKVISLSLGAGLYTSYCDSSFPTLASAINNAVGSNITVTVSSGNDGSTTQISSPGCVENATAVGATDKSDSLASYSNLNGLIDVVAPGSSINATSSSGGYTTMSGTSMSAPHVAGAIALLQGYKFTADAVYLNPYEVEAQLEDNSVVVGGYKRIDVFESVSVLDSTVPVLILDSPLNQTYNQNNISLNYTATDLLLDRVFYNINGTNITLNGNTTLNLNTGSYTLDVYAVDGNNNENLSSLSFSISGSPVVTLNNPIDNFNDVDGVVKFNCSVSSGAVVANISLYHNLSGGFAFNTSVDLSGSEGYGVFDLNFPLNQSLLWNCLGVDVNGDSDWGENRTLRINSNRAPVIDSKNPTSVSVNVTEPSRQEFNITYSDGDSDTINVSWYLDSAYVGGEDNYSLGGNYTASGNYTVLAVVDDGYNTNDTFEWNFEILNLEYCGDDVKNSTEGCDGTEFGGLDCSDYGYNAGSLSCSSCSIDSSSCSNTTSGDSSGSSGGGGGDSGGSSGESLAAFSDLNSGFDDEDFGEEIIIEDVLVEAAVEEEPIEEVTTELPQEKGRYGWIWGLIGGVVGGVLILLLLRKEWQIIMRKRK